MQLVRWDFVTEWQARPVSAVSGVMGAARKICCAHGKSFSTSFTVLRKYQSEFIALI
jgi:hypothetical protein